MTYEADARFLQALILGRADPLAGDVPGRITVLRAQYTGTGDAGILDLIWRAAEVREAADRARDVAFLQSLIDGTEDYFEDRLYARLEPLYAKYENEPAMLVMFNAAATVYAAAVVAAAQWALAGIDAEAAIDRAMGRERRD